MAADAKKFIHGLENDTQYDVLVVGAGAAGMAAALYAALDGARVLLVERTPYLGGTSALSGGTTWVPLSQYAEQGEDSYENVSAFLDRAVGEHAPKAMREAFLKAGPEAIRILTANTDVAFRKCTFHPDYMADLEGATRCGRALEPLPFVTRHLGLQLKLMRPPIPEFTVLGGMMINREDIGHLLNRFKSPKSFLYTVKLVLRYAYDRLVHGAPARSVMGHALIARMLSSALKLGVDISVETELTEITPMGQGRHRLRLKQGAISREVIVNGGVVLASGGFGRDPLKRDALYPEGMPPYSPTAPGHTGAAHRLVETLGAFYGDAEDQPAFWAPCSIRRRKDESLAVFPHFVFDRSKPGTVCVDQQGKRFVNESLSYHEFGKAMLNSGGAANPAYIITDAAAIQKFGLGLVRLGGDKLEPYIRDGYLIEANSIDALAQKLGMQPENLQASIAHINAAAKSGVDSQFHRGETIYQRANGDPEHGPNPTLGPIATAPFYAIELYPADIGTAKGFMADENAQLVTTDGTQIAGIYAAGNDLNSIMGGTYPGPGITIGPGIVFGYLAARHAVARSRLKFDASEKSAMA
ncbi:FAD-binding dehydrogenase [Marinobacterium zhoushanense]|uniref:FAD-binding dehydrogenase n=1 Tax=Marinobacterium zhoushanense TaxID=1679163 RepID=A0ABQ1KCQ7_9GAMM|nr:FAD-dependent oxidoreductase [Marinobacterium zhoushanense]GGB94858.1 FAD-binding dehydrogenase [Marinobacterium zhoushanense]